MSAPAVSPPARNTSIDALRGLVMATMIYVNDLAGAGDLVPDWMVHFSERHKTGSGMTFVDLVFPGFLFIVGMSIPFALGSQFGKPGWPWASVRHVLGRTLALLAIGVLMVNESPDAAKMGWSATLWTALLYLAAILAFSNFAPAGDPTPATIARWRRISAGIRCLGLATLAFLAFSFVGPDGHRIVTFSPFSLNHEWWGILGLIGWAYLVGTTAFFIFRFHRTALLGCMALLLCLYPAERSGLFEGLWLARHIGFGGALGSLAAITVGGLLLGTILVASVDTSTVRSRVRFTLCFIAGTAAAAVLLNGLYGIAKNSATPSWCLWACAITATLWLLLYFVSDVRPVRVVARPLAVAGQNVLLAYLLSEMLPSALSLLHLDRGYDAFAHAGLTFAVIRSLTCAVGILCVTAALNRAGLRLKL